MNRAIGSGLDPHSHDVSAILPPGCGRHARLRVLDDSAVFLENDTLATFWKSQAPATLQASGGSMPVAAIPSRERFPLSTPPEIRKSSMSFPVGTGQSLDAIHPRLFGILPDDALWTLSYIIGAAESLGFFPEQLMFMLFVLLEKPAGGFRAILLAPGFVRM